MKFNLGKRKKRQILKITKRILFKSDWTEIKRGDKGGSNSLSFCLYEGSVIYICTTPIIHIHFFTRN